MTKTLAIAAYLTLCSCSSPDVDIRTYPIPVGATDLHDRTLGKSSRQKDFVMKAEYPSIEVFEHFSRVISPPWYYCEWAPEWQSFIDASTGDTYQVHQQLHTWVDPQRDRLIVLSMQYRSNRQAKGVPDNDTQYVVLIEYQEESVEDSISRLKLNCPIEVHNAL